MLDEVAAALAAFFEGGAGPSHDTLDRLFERAGLAEVDPRRDDAVVGKMKRIRGVLWWASDNDEEAGAALVKALMSAMRAAGCFRPGEDNYPGPSAVEALREALDSYGFELSSDGLLRPKSMEGLEGAALTEALRVYVRRARTSGDDAALKVGTAKDLAEATARHVLVERIGDYPTHGNFPTTLWQTFEVLGLKLPPSFEVVRAILDGDAWDGIERAAFLLGCAINRYRNEEGTGHGRPHPSLASHEQARLAAEGAALVAELLLDSLE